MSTSVAVDFDTGRTLEELEAQAWSAPAYDSHLVATCHALRKRALRDFTPEDLRIMIGQSIGVPFLLPLAIDVLKKDPLTSGDCYDGDLLNAALTCDLKKSDRWPDIAAELEAIADRALKALARVQGGATEEIRSNLRHGMQKMSQLREEAN